MTIPPHSQKDREQFLRKVIRLYSKELAIYAFYFLRDEDDAQDTVQEVFIRLWERPGIHTHDPVQFKRYLLLSVRNACLDKIEKKNVLRRHIDRMSLEVIHEEEFHFDENIVSEIRSEIEQLPAQTRRVINAVFVRNMKYREVAAELDISVNTVKSLLKTGLKKLREKWNPPYA